MDPSPRDHQIETRVSQEGRRPMKKKRDFLPPNKTKRHLFLSFSGTAVETTWTNEKKNAFFPA